MVEQLLQQFPETLGHMTTIHKTQGSILDYMKVDLEHSSQTNRLVPIAQGQTYTLVFCQIF